MSEFIKVPRSLAVLATVVLAAWLATAPAEAKLPHPPATPILYEAALSLSDRPSGRAQSAGDRLPRIDCPAGYEASIYAQGLSSPDGLAFDPAGVLHVAEESAGQVSRIEPDGTVTPVVTGLASPEGIDLDFSGNLYVVEDGEDGRLVCVEPGGAQTVLASGRDAPEGVVWSPDESLFITESNVQFADNWQDFRTRVTRASPDGDVSVLLENTLAWSYAGITRGADGLLYVTNEASGVGTLDSIFQVDPISGTHDLFVSDLIAPEGLRFSPGGGFPLYVAEEDVGSGIGRLSIVQADGTHAPFCTGFYRIEDVALDKLGNLYVSEDTTGLVVKIARVASHRVFLPFARKGKP